MTVRLNLGCGDQQPVGWVNIDREPFGQEWIGDAVGGLPLPDRSVGSAVAHHSLQQVRHEDLPLALAEVRRVLAPGGVLRVSVPDVFAAFLAFDSGDREWFPNAVERPGVGLSVIFSEYLTWFGTNCTTFTFGYLMERLLAGGFEEIAPCGYGWSSLSEDPGIVALDARDGESIWVEARV